MIECMGKGFIFITRYLQVWNWMHSKSPLCHKKKVLQHGRQHRLLLLLTWDPVCIVCITSNGSTSGVYCYL